MVPAVFQFPSLSIGANTLTVNGGLAGSGVAIIGATTLTGAATFNVASPNAVTLAGAVGGNGSLTVAGNGLLVLAASNNYAGTTTVNGGTLQVGTGGATGTLGAGAITTNATLAFNRGDTPTITQTIVGSGGVANIGAGAVTLSGPNSYQGGTNIIAGAMTAASDTAFGSGPLSVAASATANFVTANPSVGALSGAGSVVLGNAPATATNLTVNSAGNSTFSGVISDAVAGLGSSLTKAGPGTLTLTTTQTYGGATYISQGTLRLTPPLLLTDTLKSTTLNTAIWTTNTSANGNAQVVPTANGVELISRGYLNTLNQYNPALTGGLDITGDWVFTNTSSGNPDMLQVDISSSGVPNTGNYGEVTNAIEFFYQQGASTPTFNNHGGSLVVGNIVTSGDLNVNQGDVMAFNAKDDGAGNLTFTVIDLTNSTSGMRHGVGDGGHAHGQLHQLPQPRDWRLHLAAEQRAGYALRRWQRGPAGGDPAKHRQQRDSGPRRRQPASCLAFRLHPRHGGNIINSVPPACPS